MVNPPMVHLIQTLPPWLQRYWFFSVCTPDTREMPANRRKIRLFCGILRMADTPIPQIYACLTHCLFPTDMREKTSKCGQNARKCGRLCRPLWIRQGVWRTAFLPLENLTLENTREIHCITADNRFNSEAQHIEIILRAAPPSHARRNRLCLLWMARRSVFPHANQKAVTRPIWGVWRDSNSPLILFESRGCVALSLVI